MNVHTQSVQWASLSIIHAGLGNCRLALPETMAELQQAVEEHPDAPILGNGSNLIGMDSDSYAIRLPLHGEFGVISQNGNLFTVGAAIPLTFFLRRAAELGYGGYAQLAGIPGTIGGVVKMNAGALGKEIGSAVRKLKGLNLKTNSPWEAEYALSEWHYRTSPIPSDIIITSVTFELLSVNATQELQEITQELQRRKRVTPEGASCGSVFRNP